MESNKQITFVAPSVEELNDMLPGYNIEKFIAQGGMGAVYLATQTSLDRQVAIKILPKALGDDPSFKEAFQVEAKLMAKLNHPNLISVYDFGDIEGMLYIIMEFAKGTTLHHLPFEEELEHSYVATVSAEIASGLFEAHEAGILHRDIKPSNILLSEKNSAKISDFGLARPHGETESGIIYGTPGYTAPEVLKNPAAVDVQADIFSVGVLIYELLTGKLPKLAYVPASTKADADPDFDKIIRKATHPSPKMRYKSAKLLADDLQALATKLENPDEPVAANPLLASPSPTTSNTPKASPASSTNQAASAPATPLKPKSGKKSLFINLIVITVLAGACYFTWQSIQKKQAKVEEINEANKIIEASAPEVIKVKAPTPVARPTKKTTSYAVALSQLKAKKDSFANGGFNPDNLPDNAFAKKSSHYLYIDEAMTWYQAKKFAKEYGAQLATITSKVDARILKKHAADNTKFWLGAATSSDHIEQIDGTHFPLDIESPNALSAVSYSSSGATSESLLAKNPFFIQWHSKGEKPSSTPSQLLRLISTLENSKVSYPPLTHTSGTSHYYVLKQSTSWKKANDIARLTGGHLAVISNSEEAEAIQELLSKTLKPNTPCWVGSSKKSSGKWRNVTLEKGQYFKPLTGKGDALAIYHNGRILKHRTTTKKRKLTAFVIEWSTSEFESYKKRFTMNEVEQLDDLQKKTSKLYRLEQKKLKAVLKRSVSRLTWALKTWLENTTKDNQANAKNQVAELTSNLSKAEQIPEDLAFSGLPASALRIAHSCVTFQERDKANHEEIISTLSQSYLEKLQAFYNNESFKSSPRALAIAEAIREHKKDPKAIFQQ